MKDVLYACQLLRLAMRIHSRVLCRSISMYFSQGPVIKEATSPEASQVRLLEPVHESNEVEQDKNMIAESKRASTPKTALSRILPAVMDGTFLMFDNDDDMMMMMMMGAAVFLSRTRVTQ